MPAGDSLVTARPVGVAGGVVSRLPLTVSLPGLAGSVPDATGPLRSA